MIVHGYQPFPIDRIKESLSATPTADLSFNRGCLSLRRKEGSGGGYYLMCTYSNRFRDRDVVSAPHKGGEIVSGKAHEKYMALLDANPDLAPQLWSLHIPGTERKNRAHWWDYDGYFSHAEFLLTEKEAAGVAAFCKEYEPGLSHGFFVLEYDKEEAVIESYVTYEISILPLEWAANQWTTLELIRKELEMKLTPERRAALAKLHGEDFVKSLETKGDQMLALLTELDVEMKGLKDQAEEGKAEDSKATTTEDAREKGAPVTQGEVVAALKTLHQAIGEDIKQIVDGLTEKFLELEERLGVLESEDSSRVAAKAMAAPASVLGGWIPGSVLGDASTSVSAKSALAKGPEQEKSGFDNLFAGFTGAYQGGE